MPKMLTDTIAYVGVDLPAKHKFENQYAIPHGMAYNSYIIFGEKIALLDTVDSDATTQWLLNVESALGDRKPDYIVLHHAEPDHSANVRAVMDLYPELKLVASAKAHAMIKQFFEEADYADRIITVGDGDTLDLGDRELKIFTAPFVHWPEVIVSYDAKDQVLFSADGFGKFGALQYDDAWLPEARRYYCNIVGKYGMQVQTLLKKVAPYQISMIAPLHGPMLKGDLAPYFDAYQHWSTYTPEVDGVLVAYSSIYGDTAQAAELLAQMLRARSQEVVVMDLCNTDLSEAVAQAFRMSRAVFASVTYDGGLFPAMHEFLHHLQIKNWQKRRVALIENGTWAPVAARIMTDMLSKMKNIEIISPTLSLRSALHKADLPTLEQIALQI